MGMLINGRWSTQDRTIQDGAYVRPLAPFGSVVPDAVIAGFSAEPGRYHLIVSLSCPWSHRLTLVRAIKELNDLVPMHVATGPRTHGYRLGSKEEPWNIPGTDVWIEHLHELYSLADPHLTARATVPVLWDSFSKTIISNESAQILPALDRVALAGQSEPDWTLSPSHLKHDIRVLSDTIHLGLSNAVYRAGKARHQDAYEDSVEKVFSTLQTLEEHLDNKRFLHGLALTETDLRLWPTLARFDQVYFSHFKCSRKRLVDYPNLWGYARDIHSIPGVAETFDPASIRQAYYGEDLDINPFGVVATAPDLDWHLAHNRHRLGTRHRWTRDGQCLPIERVDKGRQGAAVMQ